MNKFLSFKDMDNHYYISILGFSFCIKHKNKFIYKDAIEYGLTNDKRTPKLIVSLTSYPARINTVYKTINTLMNQSLKADKIILWLATEDFPHKDKELLHRLLTLKNNGLTIKWCDDYKSYKKLIPTLKEYPNDIIVTADDDVYYQSNTLEILYKAYLNNPNNIYVRRSVKLQFVSGDLKGVSSRKYNYKPLTEPSYFNQLMGGSGCLYPPHSLYKDCTNYDVIQNTIPTHDDVFFWAMAILNKTKIQVVGGFNEDLYFVEDTQNVGLIHKNKKGNLGVSLEEAYKIMIKKYPQIINNLQEEV